MPPAQFVHSVVNGDALATQFLIDMLNVLHFWDGLAHGLIADAQAALWAAVIDLPKNPFYRQHFETLHPLVQASVLDMLTAQALEANPKASEQELTVAFIARQSWASLLLICASLTNGPRQAAQMGAQIRLFVHGEGFAAYVAGLRPATAPEAVIAQTRAAAETPPPPLWPAP